MNPVRYAQPHSQRGSQPLSHGVNPLPLQRASQLATLGEPEEVRVAGGAATVKFDLPRQGVSLLLLEWK